VKDFQFAAAVTRPVGPNEAIDMDLVVSYSEPHWPGGQGHGKVPLVLVNSLMILSGLRSWWRRALVMLVAPDRRSRLIAVFLRVAMIRGAWPVRTREASSA